jgi:hypothetical protein
MLRLLLVLLLGCLLPACDRLKSYVERYSAKTLEDGEPVSSPGHYERRFLFLDGQENPNAAVFDFTATVDSAGHAQRTARVWLGRAGQWESLVDTIWETPPMREPWRLVPHGPLRLIVGQADTLEALVYRDANRELRLVPGEQLAQWQGTAGTEIGLHRAELHIEKNRISGILFDLQFGSNGFPAPSAIPTHSAADSLAPPAGPYEALAFLSDGKELDVMLVSDTSGLLAWVRQGKTAEKWDGAGLEPLGQPRGESSTSWRLTSPQGALRGELRASGQPQPLPWPRFTETNAPNYYPVRGWITVRGKRTSVSGLVRQS